MSKQEQTDFWEQVAQKMREDRAKRTPEEQKKWEAMAAEYEELRRQGVPTVDEKEE